jgi:hypothetical protein
MNKLTQTEEDIVQLIKDKHILHTPSLYFVRRMAKIIHKLSAQLEESKLIKIPIGTQDCEIDY